MMEKMHTEKIAHPVLGSYPKPTETMPASVADQANTNKTVSK